MFMRLIDFDAGARWVRMPDDDEAGEAAPAMHHLTGTFADASHTAEFGPQVFRSMFWPHMALMGAMAVVCALTVTTLVSQGNNAAAASAVLGLTFMLLGMLGRVGAHRMGDKARAQRYGAMVWSALVVGGVAIDMLDLLSHGFP